VTREERVALAAYRAVSPVAEEIGGAVAMRFPGAPDVPMLNRIVGLGVEGLASEPQVDAAIAAMGTGTSYYVAVAPSARQTELPSWLEARRLERRDDVPSNSYRNILRAGFEEIAVTANWLGRS